MISQEWLIEGTQSNPKHNLALKYDRCQCISPGLRFKMYMYAAFSHGSFF